MSQPALFPMNVMNVTQAYGSGTITHKNAYAIDIAGQDSGISAAHAPFDCKVVHRYAPADWNLGHTVWFESLAPVQYADGTVDFAVVSMTHDNDVSDLPVGKTFSQGQKIYDEGTAGRATGNHIHLECGRGKFAGTGWRLVGSEWVINNAYRPEAMLALFNTKVVGSGGLRWKNHKEEDMAEKITLDGARIIGYTMLGYNGIQETQNALKGDVDKLLNERFVGRELTNAMLYDTLYAADATRFRTKISSTTATPAVVDKDAVVKYITDHLS